jgi:ribosomal protein S18 acetylase RimI-like enzyme
MTCCGETMISSEIVLLKESQIDEASEILASAFHDDPIFGFLPESKQQRNNILKWNFKIGLHYNLPYNHIYIYTTVGSFKGVAAWTPPGHSNLSIFRLLPAALALPFKVGWRIVGRFMSLLSILDENHKRDMPLPHWYLDVLGVAPATQGQGIGSLLLQPVLKQADTDGLPCYLQTSTERGVRFYQKNGFEVLRSVKLPKQDLYLWTMKRQPIALSE